MKISIIGTHSTGKTTLVNKLQDRLNNLGVATTTIPEFSRICPYPINEKTSFKAQKWIQDNQIESEEKIDHKDKILITDRATLDNFAYMWRAIKDFPLDEHEQRAAKHMDTYDYIFKTKKMAVPGVEDGFRSTEEEFRNEIDLKICYFLEKYKVKYYLLEETIDYDTHINFILEKIKITKHSFLASIPFFSEVMPV